MRQPAASATTPQTGPVMSWAMTMPVRKRLIATWRSA